MPLELKVPSVGESITEVEISEWQKAEGESVKRDEVVAILETEKVTVELPAPGTGVITKILKKKGETAKVGDVIGYMEVDGKREKGLRRNWLRQSLSEIPRRNKRARRAKPRNQKPQRIGSGQRRRSRCD